MPRLGARVSETVAARLAEMVSELPAALSRTLAWDRGVEMVCWRGFAGATAFEVYFCDPRPPWQRGTNENTNGSSGSASPRGRTSRRSPTPRWRPLGASSTAGRGGRWDG